MPSRRPTRWPWFVLLVSLAASDAQAQSKTEAEARRQLEFARGELTQRNYERALTSADSALRLDPTQYGALLCKAEAYEGLGNLKMAESMALSYFELTGTKPGGDPAADAVLSRIQKKLTAGTVAADSPGTEGVSTETMPTLPRGSEDFLRWLITREAIERAAIRRDVGGALLAGGAGLAGAGGALLGIAAAQSAGQPWDANVQSLHSAGLGSVFAGGALVAVAVPLLIDGGVRGTRLRDDQLAFLPEFDGSGLRWRF